MIRLFSLMGVLVLMVACTSQPEPLGKPLPHMDYSALTPYTVRSGHTEVRKTYLNTERPKQANFVRFPDMVLKSYTMHRFDQKTGARRMVFDVQRLNLTKRVEEMKYFDSLFGNEKEIYDYDLFITITPIDNAGLAEEPYTIGINRQLVITPDLSLAEREFRQFEFLEKIMTDLDGAVTNIVTKMNN